MYPPMPVSYMNVPADPRMKELAEQRVATARKLTDALFEWLSFSDRLTIDTFDIPVPSSSSTLYRNTYTTEDLIGAVKRRDATQAQIDSIRESLNDESVPEMQVRIIEATIVAPLQAQLDSQNEWISNMQREIEGRRETEGKEQQ